MPAVTRRRMTKRSSRSAASCVRATTPCCRPASRAIDCPRAGGRKSLRISLRIPATWPGWRFERYRWVTGVTGALRPGAPGREARRVAGGRPGPAAWRPGRPPERRSWLDQERDDQQSHDVCDLDHRVDGWAGGVLVRVADRVAGDRGGVGLRALSAVLAVLDQLLGVVPGAAACRHRDGGEEADHDHADQESAEGLGREQTDHRRDDDRDQGW